MTEIAMTLLLWLGAHTSYAVGLEQPNIVLTERNNVCARYGIRRIGQCEASGLQGFYDKSLTIYLTTRFDADDSHYQSQLLHELAHYVQYRNGAHKRTCLGLLELEAYELQDRWREERGLPPVMDEFRRIMLGASCDT